VRQKLSKPKVEAFKSWAEVQLGRKNVMFAGSDAGGETLADAMTIIENCQVQRPQSRSLPHRRLRPNLGSQNQPDRRTAALELGSEKQSDSDRGLKRGIYRLLTTNYDKTAHKQRHKVENMFGNLKDWRRIATRCDRSAHTFFSAICITAIVTFWI